jgi:Ca2+-binding EF-hand superfamily protein
MPAANRERLMHSLDSDGDGRIDLEEFRQLFKK